MSSPRDPTELTTEQLLREVGTIRAFFDQRLNSMDKANELLHSNVTRIPTEVEKCVGSLKELNNEKFLGIAIQFLERDKRTEQMAKQIQEALQSALLAAKESVEKNNISNSLAIDERFRSIAQQFSERDTRTEQGGRDSKVAVDAALQAAKELVAQQNTSNSLAITKSETATMKQIDQIALLIATLIKSSDEKINDLKERLDRGDGKLKGTESVWGYIVGIGGLVLGIASVIVAVFSR